LPLPLLPAVMVIQLELLEEAQLQVAPAVTLTLPVLPLEASEALEGEILYVQAAPAWVTVKACPAMVRVPVRELVAVFAATE
jgi:hypothetical protein